jgi:hypothetical protein
LEKFASAQERQLKSLGNQFGGEGSKRACGALSKDFPGESALGGGRLSPPPAPATTRPIPIDQF